MMTTDQAVEDHRRSRRFGCTATLTYFPFTSRKVRSTAVRVLNCSRGGLSIQSSHPLKPGQTICIRPRSHRHSAMAQEPGGALLKPFALGEVRWCVAEGEGVERYNIGVKYI